MLLFSATAKRPNLLLRCWNSSVNPARRAYASTLACSLWHFDLEMEDVLFAEEDFTL
jgi:hypothetical protein